MILKKNYLIFVIFLCSSILFNINSYADESEKIEKIMVTGVGIDFEKARQNAIRNAIEQVIGTYVSSDTMVKNSQVIKDQILSYSGGYVKNMDVIAQERTDDGLFSIKIEALVISTKLKRKIESMNIAMKKVEGESLFAEASSKIDEQRSGQELLDNMMSKYPQAAYIYSVNKPSIVSTNPNNEKTTVQIPIIIKWDEAYIQELRSVLSKIAGLEIPSADLVSFNNGDNRKYNLGNKILCIADRRPLRSGRADTCYVLGILGQEGKISKYKSSKPKKSKKTLLSLLKSEDDSQGEKEITNRLDFSKKSLFNLPISSEKMSLILKFKDKSGKIIDEATYNFQYHDSDNWKKQEMSFDKGHKSSSLRSALKGEG